MGKHKKKHIIVEKLVRDKIPDMIKDAGGDGEYYHYPEADMENLLLNKMGEELGEFLQTKDISKLADVYEVFLELLKFRNTTLNDIEKIRLQKLKEKGGFNTRVFLLKVEEK